MGILGNEGAAWQNGGRARQMAEAASRPLRLAKIPI